MNPAVMQYLDASTGHLPEGERAMLASGGPDDACPRVIPHDYGWWVHVPTGGEDYEELAESGDWPWLLAALRFARAHGCNWINFDCDASEVDGLAIAEDMVI